MGRAHNQVRAEIRRAMAMAGISQTQLAKRLGVTDARVSHMLNKQPTITLDTVEKIALALDARVKIELHFDDRQASGKAAVHIAQD
ncbi:MAG: helix-turn-helix transcriptional regulator [Rhizorhabdus sp.]